MLRGGVSFLDELRAYLRDPRPIEPPDPAVVEVVRRHVYGRLGEFDKEKLKFLHEEWTDGANLVRFVSLVLRELERGLAPAPERRLELLRASVDYMMPAAGLGGLRPLELLEVQRIAQLHWFLVDVPRYAEELGLLRDAGLTRAGEMFLSFLGRDAVEWVLHLEVLRSADVDVWRMSRSFADSLLRSRWKGEGYGRRICDRLTLLGVLTYSDGYTPTPLGRELLTNVLADPPTPMHLLAKAAISDDLSSLSGARTTAASSQALESTALFAHEVRNALGPVRAAVDQLVRGQPSTPALLERIQRGFDRLDRLASEAARLSQQLGAPQVVSVAEAVEEALAATQHERNGRLRVERYLVDAHVVGRRERLVSALVNLVRNAAQAAPAAGAVLRVSLRLEPAVVRLTLSDNGPGIPERAVGSLFQPGFSLRGGSGLGLAHVLTVITEMGGVISHRHTEGGGATFEIMLRRSGGEP
jgi:signal transduction histidine kinase